MFRAITDLHAGVLPLRVWNAGSIGQWRNIADARCSEVRAVTPRVPSSFRICVHDRIDAVFADRGDVESSYLVE